MAKLLHGLSRAAPGLLALRPTLAAGSLKPGMVLKLGGQADGLHAALLCWRGGVALAAPISGWPHHPAVHSGPVPEDASEGAVLIDQVAGVVHVISDESMSSGLPGLIDCFGASLLAPLDDGAPRRSAAFDAHLPLMAVSPLQADLQPIGVSLHTGTAAVDVLTPIGRGQTMLVIGQEATGKSSIALDSIVAQASTSVHCVLALSTPGPQRAAELAAWLCERADAFAARNGVGGGAAPRSLGARLTIVAPRGETAAERTLVAAAACALGERVRDRGGHALVVVDEWRGPCDLWDEAAAAGPAALALHAAAGADASVPNLVAAARRLEQVAAEQRQHGAEQRVFYGAMLQRAAQLSAERGGGSLTMIATVQESQPPTDAGATEGAPTAPAFAMSEFASRPRSQRVRLEALAARGIRLNEATLMQIGIPPPQSATGSAEPRAATGAEGASRAAAALARASHRSNWSHLDQLKSLADGHLQLHAELFALGRRPALRPHESIARVGVGSDAAARPQPSSEAMTQLARSLRLELAQAADLGAACDAHSVLQRTRTQALSAALCTQLAGSPRPLSDEVALLLALIHGHLDHLALAPAEEAAKEVEALLRHVRTAAPDALHELDRNGRLPPSLREELRRSINEKMPKAGARGLFVSWDSARGAAAA